MLGIHETIPALTEFLIEDRENKNLVLNLASIFIGRISINIEEVEAAIIYPAIIPRKLYPAKINVKLIASLRRDEIS